MEIGSDLPLLTYDFYQSTNVVMQAEALLGCCVFTEVDGAVTGGMIVETEAYEGVTDKASHAFGGRFTNRTEVMFRAGGIAYVYLCYGMHHMFNIVTAPEGMPHAILVRGIVPMFGIHTIKQRMSHSDNIIPLLSNGPGKVCKSLGIDKGFNAEPLCGKRIRITARTPLAEGYAITVARRVGINYAGTDALLPYRFILSVNGYRAVGL